MKSWSRANSRRTKKIYCVSCGNKIGRHEPDLVLRNLAAGGKPRYYHTCCAQAAYEAAAALPAVYHLTHRYISARAN